MAFVCNGFFEYNKSDQCQQRFCFGIIEKHFFKMRSQYVVLILGFGDLPQQAKCVWVAPGHCLPVSFFTCFWLSLISDIQNVVNQIDSKGFWKISNASTLNKQSSRKMLKRIDTMKVNVDDFLRKILSQNRKKFRSNKLEWEQWRLIDFTGNR